MLTSTKSAEPATYAQRKYLVGLSNDNRYWDEPMTKAEAGRNIDVLKRRRKAGK